ncbi:TRAP-type C4-dicarboxylate transport system, small permease component [Thalassovita gelatinovora]|uniref:TRAP transporter small permease protein n=1 Tax=Thalassovita gelatinovora TaxID=53501 RepID=A0A0P1FZ64_THAGE|nr:TRAP transporter small permease [Thalassovita gelatinovora]QIZ81487.1 TRAP transporter small permease [Thalassovita gelatinovora]CUH66333.1 TRAP-type C4-dicarboxylate transport system, small permease component [Thalassovita gelatinovora]SEQ23954.1 TRAP-type C4-dicarboxylate transport system, small permease component [Thalassovita gelatinovora]
MQRFMNNLARGMAMLGGVVLTLLIILTCLSVLGRTTNTFLHSEFAEAIMGGLTKTLLDTGVGPITGDFELVEAGIAFSIFAFIPWCQITGGHASVDIFTSALPVRVNRFILMVGEILFALALILISWRLYDGTMSKMRYGETTFLLQFPIWWAFAISLVGSVVSSIVTVYMAVVRTAEFFRNETIVHVSGGADH